MTSTTSLAPSAEKNGHNRNTASTPSSVAPRAARLGKVAAHDLDAGRQRRDVGIAGQRTHAGARVQQLGADLSAERAGRSAYQDHATSEGRPCCSTTRS